MPIESKCTGCGQTLRVGDEHAGKQARCPSCGTVYTVGGGALSTAMPGAPQQQWRVRTQDGQVFGPADKPTLDGWVNEGRVAAQAQLQRAGETEWRPASTLYPQLARPSAGAGGNPFGERYDASSTNPYASPEVQYAATNIYAGPGYAAGSPALPAHRGGLVLTLAIVGWVVGVVFCPIVAVVFIPAFIMGMGDLRAMREGSMDPSGHGITLAAVILSGIGGGLFILGILAFVVLLIIAAMA